jgi:hypothetical protein
VSHPCHHSSRSCPKTTWLLTTCDVQPASFDFQQDVSDPTVFYVTERYECTLDHLMNVQLKRDYYEPCKYNLRTREERVRRV